LDPPGKLPLVDRAQVDPALGHRRGLLRSLPIAAQRSRTPAKGDQEGQGEKILDFGFSILDCGPGARNRIQDPKLKTQN
jgi:hypothetical protein